MVKTIYLNKHEYTGLKITAILFFILIQTGISRSQSFKSLPSDNETVILAHHSRKISGRLAEYPLFRNVSGIKKFQELTQRKSEGPREHR